MGDTYDLGTGSCPANNNDTPNVTDTGSNPQEEIPVRICLPDDKCDQEGFYVGPSTSPEDCEIRPARESGSTSSTEPIGDRNDPICPIQVISDGDSKPRDFEVTANNSDFDVTNGAEKRSDPEGWTRTVTSRLHELQWKPEACTQDDSSPDPLPEGDRSEQFIKDISPEECTQCTSLENDINERHYFTHVRSIIICDDEPLANVEAMQPRVIDTFTDCHAYQLALWQTENIKKGVKVVGRLAYWTTPFFLVGLLMQVRQRLNRSFPFNILSSTKYAWKATPVLLSYTSKDGVYASITPGNFMKDIAKSLPEPAHELVHMIGKSSQWMGACFNVWISVETSALCYPQHIVTSAEDRFLKRVRQLLIQTGKPIETFSQLLHEFHRLKEAETPIHSEIDDSINDQETFKNVAQKDDEGKDLRASIMRHAALKRAINSKLGQIQKSSSVFRNGSQKPHSIQWKEDSLRVQMHKKHLDTITKNHLLKVISPLCGVHDLETTKSANTAKETSSKKSTNSSKRSRIAQEANANQNRSRDGTRTYKERPEHWSRNLNYLSQDRPGPTKSNYVLTRDRDQIILQDQRSHIRDILMNHSQEDQLFYLRKIKDPHPRLRQMINTEIKLLEWRQANYLLRGQAGPHPPRPEVRKPRSKEDSSVSRERNRQKLNAPSRKAPVHAPEKKNPLPSKKMGEDRSRQQYKSNY